MACTGKDQTGRMLAAFPVQAAPFLPRWQPCWCLLWGCRRCSGEVFAKMRSRTSALIASGGRPRRGVRFRVVECGGLQKNQSLL